jgi:hypothetical protein
MGNAPQAGLKLGSDGALYGTTPSGGLYNEGTLGGAIYGTTVFGGNEFGCGIV